MAYTNSILSGNERGVGGHAILPARSSHISHRRATCLNTNGFRFFRSGVRTCRRRITVQATEQLQKPRDVEEGQFTYTVDSLSSIADKLIGGEEAPTADQIAKGVNSSLQQGLSDSHARTQERVQAFGTNRLPSRKEVNCCLDNASTNNFEDHC